MSVDQPFFERDLPGIDASSYSAGGAVRSVRFADQSSVAVEVGDVVALTMQIDDGFRTTRASGLRRHSDVARIGRAFLDGPGDRPTVRVEGRCRLLQMRISPAALDRYLVEDHDRHDGLSALRPLNGEVDLELLRLVARSMAPDAGWTGLAARMVVARLASRHPADGVAPKRRGLSPARLRRVQEAAAADLPSVTVGAMAAVAGLSVYHFAREFRHETGQTPWAWVTQQRLWSAMKLTGSARLSLEEVARAVGFSHSSHLCRVIRREFGCSARSASALLVP